MRKFLLSDKKKKKALAPLNEEDGGQVVVAASEEKPATEKKRKNLTWVHFAWSASVAGMVLVFALQSLYPDYIGAFSNITTPIIAGGAFVASLQCLRKYGTNFRGRFDRVWIYFAIGMVTWTCAETIWAIYYFFLNVPIPYPSVADFFYTGAYIPLTLAVLTYFAAFRAGMTRRGYAISFLCIAVAASLVISFILPVEFAKTGEPAVQVVADVIYPILDLVLFSATIFSVVLFAKGKLGVWWFILAAGFIFDILGDEIFLYLSSKGTYYNGSFDDLLYDIAYFLFILAFYSHKRQL